MIMVLKEEERHTRHLEDTYHSIPRLLAGDPCR